MHSKENTYVVFVDLDKTLLSVNSGKVLVIEAYKKGFMSKYSLFKAFIFSLSYKLNIKTNSASVEKMVSWLKGLSEETIIKLSEDAINKTLLKTIRPSIQKELENHKKQGGEIILLSAALPYLCKPIAEFVGINKIICSIVETNNGLFTGEAKGKICIGPEKRTKAKEYCQEKAYKLSEAFYYGDSFSDKFVMEATGNPVCVYPDKKLKKLAILRNWKIIET